MGDIEELLIKMEREFQKELEAQKKFYESKIELLYSEFEYFKNQMELETENKVQWAKEEVKSFYDVKSVKDTDEIKKYYENKLQNQKEWYEKEIQKRQKETEDWHIKNLKEKLEENKKYYENIIKEQENSFKVQEETFNTFIEEQKNIYEEQIRPFKKLIRLKNKIEKKLDFLGLKGYCKTSAPNGGSGAKRRRGDKINNEITLSEGRGERTIKNPKVSIIVPVYNVEKYLRQSLDSLINQTLSDIEIICIDDGSTDGCYDILEEYKAKDDRIKIIHKSNKGTGAARNDGLRTARGECIGFVDPDDFVKPNMFERLYNEITEKNLDIAMCMPDGYDEKNKKTAPFPYFIDDNFKSVPDNKVFNWQDLSPFKYPMCVWNKLYTKKLLEENNINFSEGLDFEDHEVIFGALLRAKRIFFIREKLYVYRFNREGSVLTDNNRRLTDHIEIFDIVENIMRETNTFDILKNDFLVYKVHNLLYYYGRIKEEFKKEYHDKMIKSLRDTNLTKEEYNMLCAKYSELKNFL